MMPSKLDEVFESARAVLEARRQEALERAQTIRGAVDAYAEAVELEMAADAARKLGVEGPAATSASTAAQALLDLVADLPELRAASRESAQASVERPGATMRDLVPLARSNGPRRPATQSYEAGPEARALWDELKALEAEDTPTVLFKAAAAELAARARILQDRGENAELIPERVIKTLTAIAGERGIRGIFGLARHHDGDWEDLANKARAERERLEAGGQTLLTAKMPIIRSKTTEKPRAARNNDADDEDEPADDESASYPELRQAAVRRPVVLVGGIAKQPKLQTLKRRFGFDVEWAETDAAGSQGVRSLEGRILDGNVAALVILEGLGGHKHFEPLVAAARQTGTPLAYGDTAGTGALRKAFREIEQKLSGSPS